MTLLPLSLAHADPTAVIEAVATNLRSDAGALGCRLFASEAGFPQAAEAAIASTGARITGGQATCRFDGVSPGTYAVVVVHDENDSVGVVVVEGVKAGQKLNGWIMDQDKDVAFDARSDIPIGHKLAIKPLKSGDTVIKYGVDIGKTIADIQVGEHTHVHNLRTKRW